MLTKFQNREDVHRADERPTVFVHRVADMKPMDSPDYRTFIYYHGDCEKRITLSAMNRNLALTLRSYNVYTYSTSLQLGTIVFHLRQAGLMVETVFAKPLMNFYRLHGELWEDADCPFAHPWKRGPVPKPWEASSQPVAQLLEGKGTPTYDARSYEPPKPSYEPKPWHTSAFNQGMKPWMSPNSLVIGN